MKVGEQTPEPENKMPGKDHRLWLIGIAMKAVIDRDGVTDMNNPVVVARKSVAVADAILKLMSAK